MVTQVTRRLPLSRSVNKQTNNKKYCHISIYILKQLFVQGRSTRRTNLLIKRQQVTFLYQSLHDKKMICFLNFLWNYFDPRIFKRIKSLFQIFFTKSGFWQQYIHLYLIFAMDRVQSCDFWMFVPWFPQKYIKKKKFEIKCISQQELRM